MAIHRGLYVLNDFGTFQQLCIEQIDQILQDKGLGNLCQFGCSFIQVLFLKGCVL